MSFIEQIESKADIISFQDTFNSLEEELKEGLSLYWDIAAEILHGSGIKLRDPVPEYFSIENNFFSALFLYSYFRIGISRSKRVLYAAVNQCLRGMVTGCDNILDDEYKKTLDTDLPEQASRFRSVLDIMVSDRVLFALLHKKNIENELTSRQVSDACFESLRALTKSGVQEASEEGGTGERLKPEIILNKVHHYKTGILFQCPWRVPEVIENLDDKKKSQIKDALYMIGMGCQIFDDMVDLSMDIRMNRHNYVASLIWHESNLKDRARLETKLVNGNKKQDKPDLLLDFPIARQAAGKKALTYLKTGTEKLFAKEHTFMTEYAISFFASRIGARRFLFDITSS
jgi:hypothetical protein